MQISNLFNKMLELLENQESTTTKTTSSNNKNKLFNVSYENENTKYFDNSNLSYEDYENFALKEEIKTLSTQMNIELTKMAANGSITPENFSSIEKLLESGITQNNIEQLQKEIDSIEEPKTQNIYKNSDDIQEQLNELGTKTRESLMKKIGNTNSIKQLEVLDNGSLKIQTVDDTTFTTLSGGGIVETYDNDYKTGFDVYDENDKLTASQYVDHTKDDITVLERYSYNEDNSYQQTVDTSADINKQKIIDVDENQNITNVQIKDKTTGEITPDLEFSNALGNNVATLSTVSQDGLTSDDIAQDEAQLAQLQQEQTETQADLTTQESAYEQTNAQKEQEVGALDTQIETEEGNLESANTAADSAQGEVDSAQETVTQAQAGVDSAQGEVDTTQSALDDATDTTNAAQAAQQTAASNQSAAAAEEQTAQNESNTANENLAAATNATNAAQSQKAATGADLTSAIGQSTSAFNIQTQKQQDVAAAQREYNSAKAQESSSKKNLGDHIKDAWNAICAAVSSAWNKLCNKQDELKQAQAEYKNKKSEEDQKRVIDEEAAQELERKHAEQDTAQDVSDAAQVILDAKTGAREVSDQELADAYLDLADAMMAQDGAVQDHDGALEAFMEAQGYKADADGNLVDKQGNLVSCKEVVKGLEVFVGNLSEQRQTTETSYNQVLETTTAVIKGDQSKLQQLSSEIQSLQENITQKKQELALQEEMLAQLTSERSDVNAYGDDKTEDKYWSDRQKLEQAIMSGDSNALEEAYKAMYGDKEVIVDENGNVVDPSNLDENQLANCTTKKLSELSSSAFASEIAQSKSNAYESAQITKMLQSGAFTVDGKQISQEDLTESLIKQVEEEIENLENAIDRQGIISKGVGALNNLIGIGTTENDARFEVQRYKELVEQLRTCKNPTQYAALYKQITGNNFSANEIVQLSAYRQANNMPSIVSNYTTTAANKVDLGEYVNNVIDVCKSEDGKVDTSKLSKTKNSKAAESIKDYQETQKNIVEGAKGVVVGVASAAIATVAVAAAPFSGGASLLLGAAVGAAAGAALNTGLGVIDSIYDADGDNSLDFNYTLEDLKNDAITGAITGGISGVTAGIGDKVSGTISSKLTSNTIATTGKEAFKKVAIKSGSKIIGEAVEGFIDGSLSSGADYTLRSVKDGTFSVKGLATATVQGGAAGGIMGAGMGTVGEIFDNAKYFAQGSAMKGKVDDILTLGGLKETIDLDDGTSIINFKANADAGSKLITLGADATLGTTITKNLNLEDVIANNLDPKYIVDGKVNKWAISQITSDAKDAVSALNKIGIKDNALEVLNNVSTDNYSNVKDVTSLLNNKNNIAILGLKGADDNLDINKASNLISGLDEVSKRADGSIEKITAYAPNGQKVALKFDEQGTVKDFQILTNVKNNADYSASTANYAIGASDIDFDVNQNTTYKAQSVDLGTNSVDDNIFTQAQKNSFDVGMDYESDFGYAANQNYVDIDTNSKATTVSRPDLEKYVNSNSAAQPISASKREQLNELILDYYNDEVDYLTNLKNQGALSANYDIESAAMAKTNTYADHINFQTSRPDLFKNNMSSNEFWTEHKAANGSHSAYKMHMYSVNEKDWEQLADAVIPYLNEHDIEWKTLNILKTPEDLTGVQKGKAFTIYPKSNEEMAQIAKDLDYIIKARKLEISGAKIQGDNALGNTGRLHYRYEYKSKEFQNEIIDMRDHSDLEKYERMYRINEGTNYLADDMLPEDDIWLGFDPSDPNSMPNI